MSMVKNEDFKILKGNENLKFIKFHTKIAKHYFCSSLWDLYPSSSKINVKL